MPESIDWDRVKLAIFDVDGTLYDQKKLRKKMAGLLLRHYMLRPWRIYDLHVIKIFRRERERMSLNPLKDLENAQYEQCAKIVRRPKEKIRALVTQWMHKAPLPFLRNYLYPGALEMMVALKNKGVKTAIYSDYPASAKLKAMGLAVDLVISSTDKEIDCLKPSPAGLHYITKILNVPAHECLFIGDRDEMDGASARKAGMPYYILNRQDKNKDWVDLLASFHKNTGESMSL